MLCVSARCSAGLVVVGDVGQRLRDVICSQGEVDGLGLGDQLSLAPPPPLPAALLPRRLVAEASRRAGLAASGPA